MSAGTSSQTDTAATESRLPLLELRGISKTFGHVQALQNINLAIYPGEVVGLVGDNGAGKSTLIKIISGAYQSDAGGVIQIDGQPVTFRSPHDAMAKGIATVYQNLALVDQRDVAANIFLGRELAQGLVLDRRRMLAESGQVLQQLRSDIPSTQISVGLLSGGQRQAVAIARAIHQGGRLIIMDEPVAALGISETRKVLQLITRLKSQGHAVIVISHNLEHVFSVVDRIAVLRRGRLVGVRSRAEATAAEIVHLIVGAEYL